MFKAPGEDEPTQEPQGDEPRQFRLPQLHQWRVTRKQLNPEQPAEGSWRDVLEEFIVSAHTIAHTSGTNALIFQTFYVDPALGPTPLPTRSFAEYYDYELITPAEPSRIIH